MPIQLLLRPMITLTASLCLLVAIVGCNGSRWARNHPTYAKKYPHHSDNVLRMAKQAVDARHVAGETGGYVGLSAAADPAAAGGSIGFFGYPESYRGMVEVRGGLQGLVAEGEQPATGGLEAGIRAQAPSRLAPFVGVGAYLGSRDNADMSEDGRDNDADGLIDEIGEEGSAFVGAIYPELGVHFWATTKFRLTASASYYLTTISDNPDFALFGLSLSYLPHDDTPVYVPPKECGDTVKAAEDYWSESPWPSEPIPGEPAEYGNGPPGESPNPADNPYASLPLP